MKITGISKGFFLFSVFYFGTLILLKPWEALFSDQFLKYHQAYSMFQSGFSTENLIYPSLDLDPKYGYFLWKAPMVFQIGDRMIGQYPIFLTLLIAPFLVFGWVPIVSILMGIFNLISAFILRRFWDLSWFWLVFTFFGTYIFLMGPELSEHPPLLLLELLGLTFFYKTEDKISNKLIGGIALGLGVWLRLEVLIFFVVFWTAGWIAFGKDWWKKSFWFSVSFSVVVLLLFLFHTLDYQHPIGPRYFQNFNTGEDQGTVLSRAFTILIGTYSMPGLLVYLPILLPLLYFFVKRFKEGKIQASFFHLGISAYVFVILIAFLAPNDGVSNWGPRYVGLALIPFVLVLKDITEVSEWKLGISGKNLAFSILLFYSFGMTLAGFVNYQRSSKEIRAIRSIYVDSQATSLLFLDDVLCGSIGPSYFQKRVLCIHNETSGQGMDHIVSFLSKKHPGEKVGFISYSDAVVEYAAKLPESDNVLMHKYRMKVLAEAEIRPVWMELFSHAWKEKEVKTKGLWEYREYEIPKEQNGILRK
ncbi:LA_3751/LA_3752 family putative glycosyltransferase [Leptospira licerasiae]|uniref:LA_3751/LA_3752 family putative glycosyltransferase n=1 Tax=Leptospira licerasiae TaxID=447106 RepID=UPI003AFB6AD0